MWKESVVAYLSHYSGICVEGLSKSIEVWGWSVSQPRFKLGVSRIQGRSITTSANMFGALCCNNINRSAIGISDQSSQSGQVLDFLKAYTVFKVCCAHLNLVHMILNMKSSVHIAWDSGYYEERYETMRKFFNSLVPNDVSNVLQGVGFHSKMT